MRKRLRKKESPCAGSQEKNRQNHSCERDTMLRILNAWFRLIHSYGCTSCTRALASTVPEAISETGEDPEDEVYQAILPNMIRLATVLWSWMS